MVEDRPEVAEHLAKNGITVLLFDAPYNQKLNHELIALESRHRAASIEDKHQFRYVIFHKVSPLFLGCAYSIAPRMRGQVAREATNSRTEQALIKGEQRLVDLEDIVVAVGDEIFNDDIKFITM